MDNSISLIPLGGIGDVTKNMYVYEYKNQAIIVDCGLGFADETMLGVDLLLPDISYLIKSKTNIIGMFLTHGHEDHIGALPFLLPSLPKFPIFASPLTAALAGEKLKEFKVDAKIQTVTFDKPSVRVGPFTATFIRVTHSIPDTAHIFIETPIGNIYHGSDFKFDDTPSDGNKSDKEKISALSSKGVLCLLSDSLGADRKGVTPSEAPLEEHFLEEIKNCQGKFIVTTYSSHIARINQIIKCSERENRKICFIGRSLVKIKEIGKKIGYLKIQSSSEVSLEEIKKYPDKSLTLLVAGSQGQGESAMARIVNNEHKDVKISNKDTIIFSSDPIPGNEVPIYELIDEISKKGARVLYSPVNKNFHVSGHGSEDELKELIKLTKPKNIIPIGGAFRHMTAYKMLAQDLSFNEGNVFLLEDGQEIILNSVQAKLGKRVDTKTVYVDKSSGEEIENFVLRDRQRLSEAGIVIVLAQIDSTNGQLIQNPDIIMRGASFGEEAKLISKKLERDLKKVLEGHKGRVTNWFYLRKLIGEVAQRRIFRELRRSPLVLPVTIEV